MKSLETSPRSGSSLLSLSATHLLRRTRSGFAIAAVAAIAAGNSALAVDGTWINPTSGGFWSDTFNWSGDAVASGADATANFATLDLAGANTVTMDLSYTLGYLIFGDTTPNFGWTIGGSPNILTLQTTTLGSTPTITVNNQTATIQTGLAGNQGFIKNGAGTLVLNTTANTWTGNALVNAGTLSVNIGQDATAGFKIADGATLTSNQALAATNIVTALSGSSIYTNTVSNNTALAGNGNVTFTIGNSTAFNTGFFSGFGGIATTNNNNTFRVTQSTSGGTALSPFATYNFASTTGGLNARNNSTIILGGIQSNVGFGALNGTTNGALLNWVTGSANRNNSYGGVVGAGASFTKVGTGTLTLNGSATWGSVSGLTVNGGTLLANYANNAGAIFAATDALNFGGGTLSLLGRSTGATAQTLGNVTVNAGGGQLIVNPNGGDSTTLTLGTITATAVGGALNIQPPTASIGSGVVTITTTSNKVADGTYGARVTFGSDWATTDSIASPYTLAPYAGYTAFVGTGGNSGVNYLLTDSGAVTGSETFNSLKVTTTGAGGALDLGGQILTLTNGGLLFAGANDYTVGVTVGDTLKSNVAGNSALIIQQLGTGNLTIASVIADGVGAQTLTKAGSGTLTLTAANTYTGQTYLNNGVTSIAANSALGAEATGATLNLNGGTLRATSTLGLFNGTAGTNNRNVVLYGNGGTLDVTTGNNLTIAGIISNINTSNLGPLTKTGAGTLTLSGNNTYGGATVISGGVLSVNTLGNGALYLNQNTGATTTNASNVVNVFSTAGITVGQSVLGGGIPAGATVASIVSPTQITLSVNANGTGQNTIVVYTPNALGTSVNTANALVLDGGTLQYTGATATTNRAFTLTQNGGALDASGSGALVFGSTIPGAYSGSGNRTLTLTGANTDNNTLAVPIGDASMTAGSSGTVGITKSGAGTWVLSNANNTYTGNTSVNSGTLKLSAASGNNIASSATIGVASGSTLDVTGLTNAKIVLGSAQLLTGSGTVSGGVTTTAGSSVSPGSSGIGTLTTGAFTINTGTIFNYEFPNSGANDLISATDLTLASLTGGLSGGGFNLYQVGTLNKFTQTGTFNLFGFSGSLVGDPTTLFTSASILNPQAGLNYAFSLNGGFIRLTISGSAALVGQWIATTNGNWSNGANWSTNPLFPTAAGTTANFTTAQTTQRTVTLDGSRTVGTVAFDSSVAGYVIANGTGTLTFDNAGSAAVLSVANGSHSITAPIALTSNVGVSVDHASDSLTISGNISNTSTAKGIVKSGPGKLTLSGVNTFGPAAGTVGFTLAAGTLGIGSSAALGAGDLAVTASNKVTAEADGLTLPNNVVITSGTTTTVDTQGNTFTLAGVVSESGGTAALTKSGNGTLKLTGTNTFTGATTINAGTLQLGNAGTTGSVAGNIVNNGSLVLNRSDDFTFSNVVSGTGSLTKLGTNNITIDGTNTFSGNTVLSGGTLTLNNALSLQGSTLNYNNQGGTLSFGVLTAATLGGLSGAQNLSLINTSLGPVTLTVGGNNQSTTYTGVLDGAGASLVKVGSNSTLTLTGVQTYTGNTTASQGVLIIGATAVINNGAIGTSANLGGQFRIDGGSVTTSALSTINSGSSFLMNSGSATFNGGLRVASTGSDGNLVQINGGTLTATDITIQRSQTYTVAPTAIAPIAAGTGNGVYLNGASAVVNTSTMTIGTTNSSAGSRIDAGSLNVTGQFTIGRTTNGGRWNIFQVNGGAFNSTDTTNGVVIAPNNGATANLAEFYISAGTATAEKIGFGDALDTVGGTGWLIVGGGNLYVGSQGIVQNNTVVATPYSANISLLSGLLGASADWSSSVPMQLSGTSFTIKAANAADVSHNIALLGALSGTGGFTKTGAGTLILSGANTYTGNTVVSAGALTLASTGHLAFAIGANGVTNSISGTGALTLDGAFDFNLAGANTTEGNLWNIVNVGTLGETFSPTFSVTGFVQDNDVWVLNDSVNLWTFTEATGNLTVAPTPEPGTIALLLSGAGLIILIGRRKSARI